MTEQKSPKRARSEADALRGVAHVFVRDLQVEAVVGIHDHEKRKPQDLRVSLDLTVAERSGKRHDRLEEVVDYEEVVRRVEAICRAGHVNLIETLAERIAASCLEDARVHSVRVRIEKPDAFEECASVGIEIERLQAIT